MNMHARIMSLKTEFTPEDWTTVLEGQAYRSGHRDARHAAAEIAAEGDALVEELAKALATFVDRDFTFFDGGMVGASKKITREEVLAARATLAKARP